MHRLFVVLYCSIFTNVKAKTFLVEKKGNFSGSGDYLSPLPPCQPDKNINLKTECQKGFKRKENPRVKGSFWCCVKGCCHRPKSSVGKMPQDWNCWEPWPEVFCTTDYELAKYKKEKNKVKKGKLGNLNKQKKKIL